jgi:hypothetical protein
MEAAAVVEQAAEVGAVVAGAAVVLQEVEAGAVGPWPGPAPVSAGAVEGVEAAVATPPRRQATGRQGGPWT